jgi:protein dithiol oxidoreductase (disulfide-forming)
MKRREFSLALGGAALAAAGTPASAQGGPVEGQHYVRLAQPVPTPAGGKVDVVEFFWYGCPHCNALEPFLETWIRRLPPEAAARRVPVGFSPLHETHQRLFYALDAMGVLPTLHRRVFSAIHVERKRLDKEADILAFMTANGVDAAKFAEQFKSFSVQTKARQAKQLAEAYRIDGVPAIGVAGRWYTSSAMAGSHERALATADYLIALSRKS